MTINYILIFLQAKILKKCFQYDVYHICVCNLCQQIYLILKNICSILLNMYIVYAALNTIEELANAPNKGNLSKVPYKLMNSPMKLRDKGVPALPKQSMKNIIENKGITCAIPL